MCSSYARIQDETTRMQHEKLKKIIFQYYGFQFFFSLLIWLPIFYEFQKRIGLHDVEIFRIQSIYYLVFCFLEIPTGLLADRWSTKGCMILGGVLVSLSQLLPIFAPTYPGMLWHFVALALARSLISGASSAYIYEFMSKYDAVKEYKRVEGKARAYGLYGKVACWTVVGVLMQWQLTAPYWLTFVATGISVYFALQLPFLPVAKIPKTEEKIRNLARLREKILHRPIIFFLILQGVAIFVLGRICQVNLFQPILVQKQFGLPTFGVVMAMMTLSEALGSAYPHILRRWITDLNAVFALSLVMGFTLALIPFVSQMGTLLLLLIFSLAAGISFPVQRQLINDAIVGNESRATILSVESIVDRAVCAWIAAILGGYLEKGNLNLFLMASGLATFVGIVLLYFGFHYFAGVRRAA